jgi:hypothetical protein
VHAAVDTLGHLLTSFLMATSYLLLRPRPLDGFQDVPRRMLRVTEAG